jgi:hypothetical protein
MSEAERILLEIEAELAEEKARKIRDRLGGTTAAPSLSSPAPRRRRATQPRLAPGAKDRLASVTPLDERRVEVSALRQGMVKP